jgi:ribosomal protein S18 acetylase RimI-like enzyme
MVAAMPNALSIRTYEPRDETAVIELVRQLQVHEGSVYDRMRPPEEIGAWYIAAMAKLCAETQGRILVGEIDGAVVAYGTIMTRIEDDSIDEVPYTYAYVGDLAVTAGLRGEGIGKAMLAECERIAREAGARWLRINSLARNTQACGTYRSYGFDELIVRFEKRLT